MPVAAAFTGLIVPRVSVVVPLYNKAATIGRCIQSIARQTFADFEVIVVDDGSTDGGAASVRARGDARFRLLHQANAGPGAARNRGVGEARGTYVAFLDADDTWDPGFLERMLAPLEADPTIAAASSSYRTANGSMLARWRREGLRDGRIRLDPATPPHRVVALVAFMSPCTTVVRRDALARLGGFYDRDRCVYGEDAFLMFKIAFAHTIEVVLEDLVTVDIGASSLSVRHPERPLEPIFAGAGELRAAAPPELLTLLRDTLALRAGKAACVLAYWGRRDEARALLTGFTRRSDLRRGWVLLANLFVSPLGAFASAVTASRSRKASDRHRGAAGS